MNSQEDTVWLAEMSEDLLKTACIWPVVMMKIVHLAGLITCLILVFGILHNHVFMVLISIIVLGGIFYQGVTYRQDIILIKNELTRRNN